MWELGRGVCTDAGCFELRRNSDQTWYFTMHPGAMHPGADNMICFGYSELGIWVCLMPCGPRAWAAGAFDRTRTNSPSFTNLQVRMVSQ